MGITPKSSWPWVRTLLHSIYDQPDADSVLAQYDRVLNALSEKLPKVADHLEEHALTSWRSPRSPTRSGARSGPTTPRNDSTERSAAGPTSSVSSQPATP